MNKYLTLFLLSLLILSVTGCRSSQTNTQEQNVSNNGSTVENNTGSVVSPTGDLPSNDLGLGALLAGERIEVEEPDSFVNTEEEYQQIEVVDVQNWDDYFNETNQLAFSLPVDYAVFEDTEGDINVVSEGAGNFFIVIVNDVAVRSTPLRTSQIVINGQQFTIEERVIDEVNEISYVTSINGQTYRFVYLFNDADAFVDLFNRVMQTVQFF